MVVAHQIRATLRKLRDTKKLIVYHKCSLSSKWPSYLYPALAIALRVKDSTSAKRYRPTLGIKVAHAWLISRDVITNEETKRSYC